MCGHSSRRRVAADTHQRPTRRFRHLLEPPCRIGPIRAGRPWLLATRSLPIWSCSVWGLPCLRRYRRSGALLPHLFTLTRTGLSVNPAVYSLWHWPSTGLDARVPDVIRHTALRSSDFPPPVPFCGPGSDRPVLLPDSLLPAITVAMAEPQDGAILFRIPRPASGINSLRSKLPAIQRLAGRDHLSRRTG